MSRADPKEQVKGQQPAVSPSLDAAAQHDGVKPAGQGLEATAETAPRPADPDAKNAGAEKILHENAKADAAHRR